MIPSPDFTAFGFAKFWRATWLDPEWNALTVEAAFLYSRLFSQPGIPMTGVLHWEPDEIARRFPDATLDRLLPAADLLAEKGYLLFDPTTAEVMVRSYVRHAVVIKNMNTAKGIARWYRHIESPLLRAVFVHELQRLAVDKPDYAWGYLAPVLSEPSCDPSHLHEMFEYDLRALQLPSGSVRPGQA